MTPNWTTKSHFVNGITLTYYVQGQGPAICFLPSTGRGASDFFKVGDVLAAAGYKVILPEPRGIGSDIGDISKLTFLDLAQDVAGVVSQETDQVVICGHAFGCWIARTLAQRHPDLVKGLGLIASGALQWDPALSAAINVAKDVAMPRQDRIKALQMAFFAEQNDPSDWLEGWYPKVVQAQRQAKKNTVQTDWWDSGTAPILDMIGLDDPFRPEPSYDDFSREFQGRVTKSFVPEASHALPYESPKATAQHLVAWIEAL